MTKVPEAGDKSIRPLGAESAAKLAVAADGLIALGVRALTAVGLSAVPIAGPLIRELLASRRERNSAASFALFAGQVEVLEGRVGRIIGAEQYLESEMGREHVQRVLEVALRAEGKKQRLAAAGAYVSGIGYGRFRPDAVLLFDTTVARLSEYHVQVLSWCQARQGNLSLRERLGDFVEVSDLANAVDVPGAIVQKIVGDLVEARVLMDTGINKIGGYWGTLSFALTSFGLGLAQYLSTPEVFAGGEVELESPFPPAGAD